MPKPRLCLYTFPPVALLPEVLARVPHDRVHLLLVAPHWPARVWFMDLVSLLDGTPWEIQVRSLSGARGNHTPLPRDVEALGLATEGNQFPEAGLSSEVVETPLNARAPSTRKLYALNWRLFASGAVSGVRTQFTAQLASLGRHPLVSLFSPCFLYSARQLRSSCRLRLPSWDLFVVLEWLLEAPFEPMESVSKKFLTLNMALLLALASLRMVGDLQAAVAPPA
ncbi:hypothetical protein QTP70_015661 [Hemibagrus guttatus]|uniref:Uncharacterized protein n=1 Tax=Hemibagrus guttatus TaxID=175788 RepID=A0AAE0Q2G2_9TELE|nr:hypothetical protein QTP70_015661 [Hemibagrus guttatus]